MVGTTACDRKQVRDSTVNTTPGLLALYYSFDQADVDNLQRSYLFKNKRVSRTDANIDFDYGNNGPPGIANLQDRFAVRWIGYITPPEDGKYTLCTCSDDGVRLVIDNQTLIDYWVGQGARFWWAEIDMERGKRYPFRLDYFDQGGAAAARLYWARNTGQAPEDVCRNVNPPPTDGSNPRGQEQCEAGVDVINPILSIIPNSAFIAAEDDSADVLTACEMPRQLLDTPPDPMSPNTQKARRLFQRLGGIDLPLFDARIAQVKAKLDAGDNKGAAQIVTQDPNFYSKTVRALAARISTRDERPDVPLNDFIATFIGVTRDHLDARKLLTGNFLYRANPKLFFGDRSVYSDQMLYRSNGHYELLENSRLPLACALDKLDRLNITAVPDHMRQKLLHPNADGNNNDLTGGSEVNPTPAGVLTSRAYAEAHYIAGTGRRIVQKSFEHFLCAPIESWRDAELADIYVGRDVERFPNGADSHSEYLNTCKTCHGPMDAMRGAFSQFHFENGYVKYAPFFVDSNANVEQNNRAMDTRLNRMRLTCSTTGNDTSSAAGCQTTGSTDRNTKIPIAWKVNHNINYADGHVITDDSYTNLLTTTRHAGRFGWSSGLTGRGPREYGRMLANSQAFPMCMARRVYSEVCRDDPFKSDFPAELNVWLDRVGQEFATHGFDLKDLFETVALGCLE